MICEHLVYDLAGDMLPHLRDLWLRCTEDGLVEHGWIATASSLLELTDSSREKELYFLVSEDIYLIEDLVKLSWEGIVLLVQKGLVKNRVHELALNRNKLI